MQEEVWTAYLEKKKNQYFELIEAEKDAERLRIEDAKKIQVGHERFKEIAVYSNHLKKDLTNYNFVEMSQGEYEILLGVALENKKQDEIGKQRFVRVSQYVSYLADPITSYDFREMTEENYDNFLLSLILAKKEEQELNRRKALISPYSRFISDKEFVLQLDLEGFNQCVTSLVAKDLEEKQIKAKREERGKKLSAILYFVDNYEALINSTDDEFQKGLAEAQARADKRTDELRAQSVKESQERAERIRLQGIEDNRKAKEAQDAKNAEKLAKAPLKRQFQAWVN